MNVAAHVAQLPANQRLRVGLELRGLTSALAARGTWTTALPALGRAMAMYARQLVLHAAPYLRPPPPAPVTGVPHHAQGAVRGLCRSVSCWL